MRRLIWPMVFGITAVMSVSLADTYFVGQLGPDQLAAISFCFPVLITVTSIAIGLSAGAASVVARAAGRGDHARVRRLTSDAIILALIVAAGLGVAGWFLTEPLFTALGAQERLMPHILAYMRTWFAGVVLVAMPILANGLLRALGDSRAPATFMVIMAVTNIVLDPLFIFGIGPFPRLEIQGAALVTLLANAGALCIAAWLLVVREKIVSFRPPPLEELADSWAEIARIGVPAALSNAINPAGVTLATAGFARFGAEAVAGFGVATRIEIFAIIPLLALSAIIGPITGQNGGAGHQERVRRAFQLGFAGVLVWSLSISIILAVVAVPVTGLFSDSPETLRVARLYLWLAPWTIAGYGVVIAASAGFNALGRPLYGMVMTFTRSLVLYAPGVWIGGLVAGVPGSIAGLGAANVLSGLGAAWWSLRRAPMSSKDRKPKSVREGVAAE